MLFSQLWLALSLGQLFSQFTHTHARTHTRTHTHTHTGGTLMPHQILLSLKWTMTSGTLKGLVKRWSHQICTYEVLSYKVIATQYDLVLPYTMMPHWSHTTLDLDEPYHANDASLYGQDTPGETNQTQLLKVSGVWHLSNVSQPSQPKLCQ